MTECTGGDEDQLELGSRFPREVDTPFTSVLANWNPPRPHPRGGVRPAARRRALTGMGNHLVDPTGPEFSCPVPGRSRAGTRPRTAAASGHPRRDHRLARGLRPPRGDLTTRSRSPGPHVPCRRSGRGTGGDTRPRRGTPGAAPSRFRIGVDGGGVVEDRVGQQSEDRGMEGMAHPWDRDQPRVPIVAARCGACGGGLIGSAGASTTSVGTTEAVSSLLAPARTGRRGRAPRGSRTVLRGRWRAVRVDARRVDRTGARRR